MSWGPRCGLAMLVWLPPLFMLGCVAAEVCLDSVGYPYDALSGYPIAAIFVMGWLGSAAYGLGLGLWLVWRVASQDLRDRVRGDLFSWLAGFAALCPFSASALFVAWFALDRYWNGWERIAEAVGLFVPILQMLWAAPVATLALLVRPSALVGLAANAACTACACAAAWAVSDWL
jgi:hypothetical protein